MSLVPRLEISQRQSLVMTHKLRQAIDMLVMNNVELSELITTEIEKNPLLERENFDESVDKDNDYKEPELDIDIDNQFNNGQDDYDFRAKNRKNDFSASDFDMDDLENKKDESLFVHLEKQINNEFADEKDRIIATNLLMNLDITGYFNPDFSADAFSKNIGISNAKMKSIIKKMQNFTPVGCFASSLKETLSIQLKTMNKLDPLMKNLLDNLHLMMKQDLNEIKKALKINEEDILSMIGDIKLCNPKPGTEFYSNENYHIIPDVIVKEDKNGNYRIELNANTLIKPLINREYIASLRNNNTDKKLNRFLVENESSASWLIRTIDQRNITILKVATEIVSKQHDFFKQGIDYLKPLNLAEIAEEIGVDESTVSRVTTGKYMTTPRGIFDMKFFFPSKLESNHSSEMVKHKIKQLIEKETSNTVLSDAEISIYLKKDGINVARRTVLKYRESLGIKPSNIRKREKKINEKM